MGDPIYQINVPLARQISGAIPALQSDQFGVLLFPPRFVSDRMRGLDTAFEMDVMSVLVNGVSLPEWETEVETVDFPIHLQYPTGKKVGDLSITFGENTAFFVHRMLAAWHNATWHKNGGMYPPAQWWGRAVVRLSQGKLPIVYHFNGAFPRGNPRLDMKYADVSLVEREINFCFQEMHLFVGTSDVELTR